VKELKGEQLPDFSMKQSGSGESQMFVDVDFAVEEERALDDERDDQNDDQAGANRRRIILRPHVGPITESHGPNRRVKESGIQSANRTGEVLCAGKCFFIKVIPWVFGP